MSFKLGFEAVLLINVATTNAYTTPDWEEVDITRDCALIIESDEVDLSMRRGKGWKTTVGGLKDLPIEIVVVSEKGNPHLELFREASLDRRKTLDLVILDGPLEVASGEDPSIGMRAHFTVLNFEEGQNIADGQLTTITMKVGYFVAGQEPKDFEGTVAA